MVSLANYMASCRRGHNRPSRSNRLSSHTWVTVRSPGAVLVVLTEDLWDVFARNRANGGRLLTILGLLATLALALHIVIKGSPDRISTFGKCLSRHICWLATLVYYTRVARLLCHRGSREMVNAHIAHVITSLVLNPTSTNIT